MTVLRVCISYGVYFYMVFVLAGCVSEQEALRRELAGQEISGVMSLEQWKCFSSSGGSFHMENCNWGKEQEFFYEGSPQDFIIHSRALNQCVDANAGDNRVATPYPFLNACNRSAAQHWSLRNGNQIESKQRPGFCMDLGLAAWNVNSPYLHNCWGGRPQQFEYKGSFLDVQDYTMGKVDVIQPQSDGLHVGGWACVKTTNLWVSAQVYAGDRHQGGTLLATINQLQPDASLQAMCESQTTAFRFNTVIPLQTAQAYQAASLKVYASTSIGEVRAASPLFPPCWTFELVGSKCPQLIQVIEGLNSVVNPPSSLGDLHEMAWEMCLSNAKECIGKPIGTIGQWLAPMWNGLGPTGGPSPSPNPTPGPTPVGTPVAPECQGGQWKDSYTPCVNHERIKTSCRCIDGHWGSGNSACITNTINC